MAATDYRNHSTELIVAGINVNNPPEDIGVFWQKIENIEPLVEGTLHGRGLFDDFTFAVHADFDGTNVASGTFTNGVWPTWQRINNFIEAGYRVWVYNVGPIPYTGTDEGEVDGVIYVVETDYTNQYVIYYNGFPVYYAEEQSAAATYLNMGIAIIEHPSVVVTTSPNGTPIAILGGKLYLDLSLSMVDDAVNSSEAGTGTVTSGIPVVNDGGSATTADVPGIMAFNLGIQTDHGGVGSWVPAVNSVTATAGGDMDSGVTGASGYKYRATFYRESVAAESAPGDATAAVDVTGANGSTSGTVDTSDDPQVTHIRLYRLGGVLDSWRWVKDIANSFTAATVAWTDDNADSEIALEQKLDTESVCPWKYTYHAAGSTFAEQDQPCPITFGPYQRSFLFGTPTLRASYEAQGGTGLRPSPSGTHPWADPDWIFKVLRGRRDVGISLPTNRVFWTNINDPFRMDVNNYVTVGEEGEEIYGGFIFSGNPFVYTARGFYALDYNGPEAIPNFQSRTVPIGMGATVATVSPSFVYFKNDKGIFRTDMSNQLSEISAPIEPLFRGETINDMAAINQVKFLRFVEPFLYVFYSTYCLRFDTLKERWTRLVMSNLNDTDLQPPSAFFNAVNRTTYLGFSGGVSDDGARMFAYDHQRSQTGSGGENEVQYAAKARTSAWNAGIPHTDKLWGNVLLDYDPNGADISVRPYYGVEETAGTLITTGTGGDTGGRRIDCLELDDVYAENMALDFGWTETATKSPTIYKVTILYRADEENIDHWEHPETSFDHHGWFHVRDGFFDISSNANVTLKLTVDGTVHTYTLSSTSGARRKVYQEFDAIRGKVVKIELDSASLFRFYSDTSFIYSKDWQSGLGYMPKPLAGQAGYADFLRKGGGT